ncbi:gamma-glutamyltransferase [Azospirillum halopraeferens]|uniref:gamma-glutamyltransferase n=1 Tax=Azospirillum halopraeferens TaxID=34010 RepID=UPI0004271467|nr:gamma-glutamyltransferase [Azospirillum halopraeferens]
MTRIPAVAAALAAAAIGTLVAAPASATAHAGGPPACAAEPHALVAAADPLAVEAGLAMLRRGGSAVDAAIAAKLALTLVEAPETGIGGGGFLLHRSAADGALVVHDGREVAPEAATPERFLLPLSRPMPFAAAVVSGRAVGVPGMVAMMHDAHGLHGRLPWTDLFDPAITMAESGVPMPARLRDQITGDRSLSLFRGTRQGLRRQSGEELLVNPDLADTLRRIADGGPDAFYRGEIARSIVAAVTGRRPWPGDMTAEDLADYEARRREPVCGAYRGWTVCGAPPPSSGGIAVLQILGMLEHHDLAALGPGSVEAVHLIAEASRLAFADRELHVADPAFVPVPVAALIDPAYLAARAALIDPLRAMATAPPGDPPAGRPAHGVAVPVDPVEEERLSDDNGTSHLVAIDREGNVASFTGSIEAPFGSRLMVRGFLLNNQLTDFAFVPTASGLPRVNAVAPGKRPRSSMAPTIVFDPEGRVRLAVGGRGGSRIIGHVVKTIVGVLDWNLDVQQAVALPNLLHRGRTLELEEGTALDSLAPALRAMGHRVEVLPLTSGLHALERVDGRLRGAADPRMGGLACGIE